jgi:hypothetical protein
MYNIKRLGLLVAKVDPDIIQSLVHCRLTEMFRCLYLTAEPIIQHFAINILNVLHVSAVLAGTKSTNSTRLKPITGRPCP